MERIWLFLLIGAWPFYQKLTNSETIVLTKVPSEIIIAGRIENTVEKQVMVLFTDIATGSQLRFIDKLKPDGTFTIRFHRQIAQDVIIRCGSTFKVYVAPGDSLNVIFDDRKKGASELYSNIIFSGDRATFNMELVPFRVFMSNLTNTTASAKTQRKFQPVEYSKFRDSLDNEVQKFITAYVSDKSISVDAKKWMQDEATLDKLNELSWFFSEFQQAQNLTPLGMISYYDELNIPFKESYLNHLSSVYFINEYYFNYVRAHTLKNLQKENLIKDTVANGRKMFKHLGNPDSAYLYNIINVVHDKLLKQLVIANFLAQRLERSDSDAFTRFLPIFNEYVTLEVIKQPLLSKYSSVKKDVEDPTSASVAIIKDIKATPAGELFKKIINDNQGKVIYIDVWATWCAPCIEEFPFSKKLNEKHKGKDVVFVYLCIDSTEKIWNTFLRRFELGGYNYFANKDQSAYLRKSLGIGGIPFYMIISKNGEIIKGSHLSPRSEITDKTLSRLE